VQSITVGDYSAMFLFARPATVAVPQQTKWCRDKTGNERRFSLAASFTDFIGDPMG
jgi:hypothetical protein